jgi:hypothetical protein
MLFDSFGIECLSLALNHGDSPLGTFSETCGETIAIMFGNETCLAFYKFYGPFGAGLNAFTATVTFFSINIDYFSFHFYPSFLMHIIVNSR